jgi:hypothetical protein
LYLFLSVIGIYFTIKKSIRLFKKKEPLSIGTTGMEMSFMKPPEDNLLFLFTVYFMPLCTGLEYNTRLKDGGYGYGVFAPRMVGYGLVDVSEKTYATVPITRKNCKRVSVPKIGLF